MKIKAIIFAGILGLLWAVCATAQPRTKATPAAAAIYSREDADAMRTDGEQRFRANCGRCHAAPQKFPPRMMATIVRHMRVRATITDEEMRLILHYMTQ